MSWGRDHSAPLSLLCIGAHSDDIEIGCGGTVLRLLAERPGSMVRWVVLSADGEREREARTSAEAFLADAKVGELEICRFRESYFPYIGTEIKDYFNELRQRVEPDLVLCHHRLDEHQDHRLVGQLVWNTFRNHVVLEYEIPKYDGNAFSPNFYVPVNQATARKKVKGITSAFVSQADKGWFTADTFMATLRLRGVECASPTKFAEAFVCRKVVL